MPRIRNARKFIHNNSNIVVHNIPGRCPLVGHATHYQVLLARFPGWGFWANCRHSKPEESRYISRLQLPEGVLKIKKGYNPNSSSIGTVIYQFPYAYIAVGAVCAFLVALIKPKKETTGEIPHSDTTDTCKE
jgi:hypothetical protein